MENEEQLWKPHPGPQTEALRRSEFEILYGGARGGGKTDAGIAWLTRETHNPKYRALIIRRNADDLKDWVDRANQLYSQLGARKVGNPPEFHWPSGAMFRTGHLKDEEAYTKYQGHEYHRMLIEELTQIPNEINYLRLLASCRSTIPELRPRVFATTNPGGIGHGWVKERFIDLVEWGKPFTYSVKYKDQVITRSRVFIHATMDDNPTLIKNDPAYVAQIEELKDKDNELYRAWRFGDWEVFAGQVFREFRRRKHVIPNLIPKKSFIHFLSFDWGFRAPFAAYATALMQVKNQGEVFNRVVTYQEWYDTEKDPRTWAKDIFMSARVRKFRDARCDPSMFNRQSDGSISIADEMEREWKKVNGGKPWVSMKGGSRNRVGRVATTHGWLSEAPDGLPYWLVTEDCVNLIKTLPLLVYDAHKVDDVDTTGEDHAWDSISYLLSSIKFISPYVGGTAKKDPSHLFNKKDVVRGPIDIDLKYFEKKTILRPSKMVL